MTRNGNRAGPGAEHGVAIVEMAFVTVLLLLLVAGIADLGRALVTNIGVQDAAQEGTLYGSFRPDSTDAIVERAIDATDYPPLDSSNVQVGPCNPADDSISVTVTYEMDLITPIVSQFLGGSITLERTLTGQVFSGCP